MNDWETIGPGNYAIHVYGAGKYVGCNVEISQEGDWIVVKGATDGEVKMRSSRWATTCILRVDAIEKEEKEEKKEDG